MGMYTEIFVNVDLKEDVPEGVLSVLKGMCSGEGGSLRGFPPRWRYLFNNGSCYTPNTWVAKLSYDSISKQYSLLGKGDIKNYEGEIDDFFDFLEPHVESRGDRTFMGYSLYEESEEPALYYKTGE